VANGVLSDLGFVFFDHGLRAEGALVDQLHDFAVDLEAHLVGVGTQVL
jgi:hypothetical protein